LGFHWGQDGAYNLFVAAANPANAMGWVNLANAISVVNGQNQAAAPLSAGAMFFRLLSRQARDAMPGNRKRVKPGKRNNEFNSEFRT